MGDTVYPWHDCPKCQCGGPLVTVADTDGWNHRAKPEDRLVCLGCGEGVVGTDAEVAQATAADAAWDAENAALNTAEIAGLVERQGG